MYIVTQIIGILMILGAFWVCFEIWRAPLLEENPDGSWRTIKESKKIMDFFKKKSKTQ